MAVVVTVVGRSVSIADYSRTMRRTLQNVTAVVALLIAGVTAGSCSKPSPTEPDPSQPAPGACGINSDLSKMSAKVNGLDWSTIITTGTKIGDFVNIVGNDGCNPSRVLTFNLNTNGTGSYKIPETQKEREQDTALLTALLTVGTTGYWDSQSPFGKGTVTFSTLNDTGATGTFFFTLQPLQGTNSAGTPSVTNGLFDVKFKVIN